MGAVIFARYNNIGEALADQSCLKAGGFSVGFHNYFHACNDYFLMQALGGLILMFQEQDYDEAHHFLKEMKRHPLEDEDPIPEKKYGYWVRATFAAGFLMGPFTFLLPIFFIFPELLFLSLVLLSGVLVWTGHAFWVIILSLPAWIVLMLLHAKYIALPKFRREQTI